MENDMTNALKTIWVYPHHDHERNKGTGQVEYVLASSVAEQIKAADELAEAFEAFLPHKIGTVLRKGEALAAYRRAKGGPQEDSSKRGTAVSEATQGDDKMELRWVVRYVCTERWSDENGFILNPYEGNICSEQRVLQFKSGEGQEWADVPVVQAE
tara:strand:- start:2713 stop:3180 length:468 start_codon:yes stop_codon:yes gene_type:complete